MAGFFAQRGYDVWGYVPRYVGIPAGTCEAGVFDCSVMDGWDLQSMLDDVAFIRSRIDALHPGTEIVAGGANILPLFPPVLTNHQVMVLVLSVPAPGPVTMPVPGYVQMAGSFAEDRLFFASEERLFENVGQFNSYVPVRTVRDISCSLAGRETAYVSNLGSFTGSVLAIGGGRGLGAFLDHQLSLFGTGDVTLLLEADFGHIDHFMTPRHRQLVERPILRWAERVLGGRGRGQGPGP